MDLGSRFVALVSVVVISVATGAQTPGPTFEVASIRPNPESTGFMGGMCRGTDTVTSGPLAAAAGVALTPPTPGTCLFRRTTVRMLIATAYEVLPGDAETLITGGPPWINSDYLNLPPEIQARLGGAGPADGPSLETALREQLGLRLQAQRVPQDILVIDRVNRPTPN